MRKFLIIVLSMAMILPFAVLAATPAQPVDETVMSYAEEQMPSILEFYTRYQDQYSDLFQDAAEISQMQLGDGFRLGVVNAGKYDGAKKLSDAVSETQDWLIYLCDPQGVPKVHIVMMQSPLLPDQYGARTGDGVQSLIEGMEILDRLAEKEKNAGATQVIMAGNSYILLRQFGKEERVITVLPWEKLDESYAQVTQSNQLPSGEDALQALKKAADASRDEAGNQLYGFSSITLKAQTATQPTLQWLAWGMAAMLCAAGIFLAFAAGRKRKM